MNEFIIINSIGLDDSLSGATPSEAGDEVKFSSMGVTALTLVTNCGTTAGEPARNCFAGYARPSPPG